MRCSTQNFTLYFFVFYHFDSIGDVLKILWRNLSSFFFFKVFFNEILEMPAFSRKHFKCMKKYMLLLSGYITVSISLKKDFQSIKYNTFYSRNRDRNNFYYCLKSRKKFILCINVLLYAWNDSFISFSFFFSFLFLLFLFLFFDKKNMALNVDEIKKRT